MANLCESQGRKATYLRTKGVYDRRVAEITLMISRNDFIHILAPANYCKVGGTYMSIKSVLKKLLLEEIFYDQETIEDEKTLSATTRDSTVSPKNLLRAVHGTVSVSDGKVFVTDPENDGSYATLIVPNNPLVQVFVNGEQVQGEVVLSEAHEVNLEFSYIEPSVSYDVTVSDDELSVAVKATVVKGAEFRLKDTIPRRHLKLVIEETNSYPHPVSPQVILDLLAKHGYNGAIDYIAVNRLCNAPGTQQEIVLRGTSPQSGTYSKIRLSSTVVPDRDPIFRTTRCPRVYIGNTCAVLEPESESVPGVNVYGVPILPLSKLQELPSLGDGVTTVNGNIVAIRDGRLIFSKHHIDVTPEMVLETDVSAENLQFDGNITIHGSIRNSSTVKTTGTVRRA